MTPKDKKIIKDAVKQNIPIFVISAKDFFSTATLADYLKNCVTGGASTEHIKGVAARMLEFRDWQDSNANKFKMPD